MTNLQMFLLADPGIIKRASAVQAKPLPTSPALRKAQSAVQRLHQTHRKTIVTTNKQLTKENEKLKGGQENAQVEAMRAQTEMEIEKQKLLHEQELAKARMAMEAERDREKMKLDAELAQQKSQVDAQIAMQQAQTQAKIQAQQAQAEQQAAAQLQQAEQQNMGPVPPASQVPYQGMPGTMPEEEQGRQQKPTTGLASLAK